MGSKANRRSSEQWAELIAQWRSSGMTHKAFAEVHGVRLSTLRWWSSEISRREKENAGSETHGKVRDRTADGPRFMQLQVVPQNMSVPRAPIEIQAPSGLLIRVQGTVDRELLRDVLDAVTGC